MSILTYSQLKLTIQELLEDDGAETSAFIGKAVFLAEDRVSKDLDMQSLREVTTVSAVFSRGTQVSTNIDQTTFIYFNDVFHNSNKLDRVEYSFTKELNRQELECSAMVSVARYYSFNTNPGVIQISPPINTSISNTFEIVFYRRPNRLSNINQTNVILERAPQPLLYRSMVEMAMFQKNWESLPFWIDQYNSSLETALNTSRRERKDSGQPHNGPEDTLQTTLKIN